MSTAAASSTRNPLLAPDANSVRLAAIDIGSNSVHMIVAQVDGDGGVTTLWRMKEMVGLGRISFPSRRLSVEAMDRAANALGRMQAAAKQRGCEAIVAVATSAVREAQNGGDFIQRIKREMGLHVRVISAREEARLIYIAVRHACELGEMPHLIIDIGGGSVEFIVGDKTRAGMLESRKLGAARMTAQYVHSDPINDVDRAKLLSYYDTTLTPICQTILRHAPIAAIGTSGTLECLATMAGSPVSPKSDDGEGQIESKKSQCIEREPLDTLVATLLKSDSAKRSAMHGLADQRRDQILAGALLVQQLFERLNLKRIDLCGSALREGILLDYLARHQPQMIIRREVPDPRRRSVLDLARKANWSEAHSVQVATLCLALFDQLAALHGLGRDERELVGYAALLHDIGWHIGRTGHHKHSMYLILNGELKEFSAEQVRIIANIARYHRKAHPKRKHEEYAKLSAAGRRIVNVGAALLRIADGLDRSHANPVVSLRCRVREDVVRCYLVTRADAELEVWGARRKMKWFKYVFGRPIEFKVSRQ